MNNTSLVRTFGLVSGLLLQLGTLCFQSHGAAGDVDRSFDPGFGVNGTVSATAVQPDGKVIIAGGFSTVKGLARPNLARLNADGSGDPTFNPGSAYSVASLVLQSDGKLLVAHAAGISRLNSDGSWDTNFNASIGTMYFDEEGNPYFYAEPVGSVAVQPDGKVLIAGNFTTVQDTNRVGIARLNTNGSLDTSFSASVGATYLDEEGNPMFYAKPVGSVAVRPDGKVVIGGDFTTVNGTNRNGIARLNASGSLDTSFNPDTEASAVALFALQSDGKVLVGPVFNSGNGTNLNRILRLNANGSRDSSFDPAALGYGTAGYGSLSSIIVQPDSKVLIGGTFISVNETNRNRIARLNANGSLDSSFDPGAGANSSVLSVAAQADGQVLIGGDFTSVNGTSRSRIARLNTAGGLDESFNPGAAGFGAASLAVQPNGKVLVGGPFTFINGTNQYGSARFNADGSLDSSFIPSSFNADVGFISTPDDYNVINTVAMQADGKLLVSGYTYHYECDFESCFSYNINFLHRVNANGSRDPSFNPGTDQNSYVSSIIPQPDGRVLIGGNFYVNGANCAVVRLNPDGRLDSSFHPVAGGYQVYSIALQPDGKALIAGSFTAVNGTNRNGIARINVDGSLDNSFNPGTGASGGYVSSVALQPDGKVLIGGSFTTVSDTSRNRIARLNADGSLDSSFNPGTGADGNVRSIALQSDGYMLIGGDFLTVNGVWRPYVARLYGGPIAGSLDSAFDLNVDGTFVLAIAVQPDGKILVGGGFTNVNGQVRNRIARLQADGTLESTATFNPGTGANDFVTSIALQADGKILLGGNFTSMDGQPRNGIARLNADGTLESTATFNPGTGANRLVNCVAVQSDGKVLLGGNFNSVNGQPRNGIARLNADGSVESAATFNLGTGVSGVDPRVQSVAVQPDGKILLGGEFTSVNGQPRNRIARLNVDGTVESTASFNPGAGANDLVICVAVQPDGKILLGGGFTRVDGQQRNKIARLQADGTLESTASFNLGTGADIHVFIITVQADGKILLGGTFTSVNGQPRSGIARLQADGTVESTNTFNPNPSAGDPIRSVNSLAVQADGMILIGGFFTSVNGQPRIGFSRLANDPAIQTLAIPSRARVQWSRGGAAPEVEQVTFELSTDGGANWTLLGPGARIVGGWERPGLSLPAIGSIRARGRTIGGNDSGSSGQIGQIATFSFVPEIAVQQQLFTNLADGGSQSFGTVKLGANTNLTFTIMNTGTADLTGLGITVDGPDAAMFTLTATPTAPISGPGGHTTFTVLFNPTSSGNKTAALHIANNDADENSFDLNLTGTMLGARGTIESVLTELTARRGTFWNRADNKKLDEAIANLTQALAADLWLDETHVDRKRGAKVFQEEKSTARNLCDLIQSKTSNLSDEVLQEFIDRIHRAGRLLASIAIQDAITAGLSGKKLEQAQEFLAQGDAASGDDQCDNGIADFGNAWKRAGRAKVAPPVRLANGRMRLEIAGEPGERFIIQASSNMRDWVDIGSRTANAEGVVTFEDADAGQHPVRYYRTVSQ